MDQYRSEWAAYRNKMGKKGFKAVISDRPAKKQVFGFDPIKKFQSFRDDNLDQFWKLSLRNGDPRVYSHLEGIPYQTIVKNSLLDKSRKAMNKAMPIITPIKPQQLNDFNLMGKSKLREQMSLCNSITVRDSMELNPQEILSEQWDRKHRASMKIGSF